MFADSPLNGGFSFNKNGGFPHRFCKKKEIKKKWNIGSCAKQK